MRLAVSRKLSNQKEILKKKGKEKDMLIQFEENNDTDPGKETKKNVQLEENHHVDSKKEKEEALQFVKHDYVDPWVVPGFGDEEEHKSVVEPSINQQTPNNTLQNKEKKDKSKKKSNNNSSAIIHNPYLEEYHRRQTAMPDDMNRLFDPKLSNDRREELFNFFDLDIAEKFAWAIPDERSLRILLHFSPLIEIGCGIGYWGHLLNSKKAGSWIGFDKEAIH